MIRVEFDFPSLLDLERQVRRAYLRRQNMVDDARPRRELGRLEMYLRDENVYRGNALSETVVIHSGPCVMQTTG